MRIFDPCPPCGRQGRPGEGFLAGSIEKPRGSAPRERDHRGGDHPVPSRTRQLSPPSPRVLQRKAAGGQGVALAEGAFLCAEGGGIAPGPRTACAGEARGGIAPCGPFCVFGGSCYTGCSARAAFRGAHRKARSEVFLAAHSVFGGTSYWVAGSARRPAARPVSALPEDGLGILN